MNRLNINILQVCKIRWATNGVLSMTNKIIYAGREKKEAIKKKD